MKETVSKKAILNLASIAGLALGAVVFCPPVDNREHFLLDSVNGCCVHPEYAAVDCEILGLHISDEVFYAEIDKGI